MNFKQTFFVNMKMSALKYGAFCPKKIFCSFFANLKKIYKIWHFGLIIIDFNVLMHFWWNIIRFTKHLMEVNQITSFTKHLMVIFSSCNLDYYHVCILRICVEYFEFACQLFMNVSFKSINQISSQYMFCCRWW